MSEYKGIFIGVLGVFLAFLSAGIEYYEIAKVANLGVLIGFVLGIYGFIIHVPIVHKRLFKSDNESNRTKEND
jgi:hypothetical protein